MGMGKRIGAICKERGISLRRLALDAGIPYTTLYSLVKRDSDSTDTDVVKRVSEVLRMDPVNLMFGENELSDMLDSAIDDFLHELREKRQIQEGKKAIESFVMAADIAGFAVNLNAKPPFTITDKATGEIIAHNVSADMMMNAILSLTDYAAFLCTKMSNTKGIAEKDSQTHGLNDHSEK